MCHVQFALKYNMNRCSLLLQNLSIFNLHKDQYFVFFVNVIAKNVFCLYYLFVCCFVMVCNSQCIICFKLKLNNSNHEPTPEVACYQIFRVQRGTLLFLTKKAKQNILCCLILWHSSSNWRIELQNKAYGEACIVLKGG